MRKIVLFILAVMVAQIINAQEWKISVGPESKSLAYNKSSVIQRTGFIGARGDLVYLMRYTDEKKTKPYLVSYDLNLNEKNKIMLPDNDERRFYGGYANENTIDLLMTEEKKSQYSAYRLSYDPMTLQPKGEPQLLTSFTKGQGERNYTFVSSSQSQEWLSVIFAVVKDDDAEWRINLYDTELEELWSMEFHMDVIDDYLVTDSGEIVVGGFYQKKNGNDVRVQFAVLDGEREVSYSDVGSWEDMQTMEIVRYHDGKIYCAGLLKGTELEKNKSRWSSGAYAMTYDTREKKVTKFEKIIFSKEDVCDLCNVPRRTRMKEVSTDKVSFVNAVYDEAGTVVEFERSFNLLVNNIPTFTSYMGVLVYRIDNDGHIAWSKVMNREVQAPNGATNGVNSRLFAHDGKYTMFWPEDPRNVNPKPEATVAPVSIEKAKLVLMATTFDRQGGMTRQGVAIPSKALCIGAPHQLGDGNYMLLLSQQFKSFVANLKYE